MNDQVEQFEVLADRETGQWLHEPVHIGSVSVLEWLKMEDDEDSHCDFYQIPSTDGVTTTTLAIRVVWN